MGPLLLAHLAALALFWWAPRFWARRDADAFSVNLADDTFHDTFHRQRLTWRVAFLVVVAALASEPALPSWWAAACSFLGLASNGSAYFFFDFNPRLNRLRSLPYVGEYYVSPDPRAAPFPDRWLWQRAQRAWPDMELISADKMNTIWQGHASRALQQLCRWVLETGVLLYLASLVLAYCLL